MTRELFNNRAVSRRPQQSYSLRTSESTSAVSCSDALRAIGQDLEARGIKTFVIRREADLYVVEAGYQSPPAPTALILHYTLDDLEQLDHEKRERRGEGDYHSNVKDFLTLSQILRVIGVYVGRQEARLLSVSNTASTTTMPVLTIEYETVQGERAVDVRTGSAIYDMCVSIYKLRGRLSVNNARDARWHTTPSS
jgi:hypothetical protein